MMLPYTPRVVDTSANGGFAVVVVVVVVVVVGFGFVFFAPPLVVHVDGGGGGGNGGSGSALNCFRISGDVSCAVRDARFFAPPPPRAVDVRFRGRGCFSCDDGGDGDDAVVVIGERACRFIARFSAFACADTLIGEMTGELFSFAA
jgi:hypothetical protein